jgi:hypothetical protein
MKRDALDTLREVNGCALHYRIFESWKLLKIQNLVAENAVLGRYVCWKEGKKGYI